MITPLASRLKYIVAAAAIALLALFAGAPGYAVDVASAAGCVPSLPHASGTTAETIATVDGTREYRLHVPPSYTGDDAVPLVLNFHGLGSNALAQEVYSDLSTRADAVDGGFIVVYPQGLSDPLPSTHHNAWQIEALSDDVAFTETLLDALESSLCIDPARVFSTGMSNGAMMSVRLACSLADRIAAVAPVAGAYDPPMALNLNAAETCGATRPVPLLAFHGTADDTVPFLGGAGGVPVTFRLPIDNTTPDDDVMQAWAARNGCTSGRQESTVSSEVRFVSYGSCDDGAAVQLYIVDGGGHTWPGAFDVPSLDYTTHDISATDLIWQFFQDHPFQAVQSDYDGDTVADFFDTDDDNDGCTDAAERQLATASEETGGRRNGKHPYDFYDTDGDKQIGLFIDVFAVASAFGDDADAVGPGEPDGYDAALDRSAAPMGMDAWDMGPPDGTIDLFTDIFGVALQYGHHC
ncbi:MAG: flexitail domain-containing putative surface protein [Dehalococcoidia bacterium]